MILNFIGNFKEAKRLKAIFDGDISPREGESFTIAYPPEPNLKDLIKKLIRYYYLTDHQVPTGKVEAPASQTLPELEHEYVMPVREKISAAIKECRDRMRLQIRQKQSKTCLGGLFYSGILMIPFLLLGAASGPIRTFFYIDGLAAFGFLACLGNLHLRRIPAPIER